DAQVHLGRETPGSYGVIAAPTRSFEAMEDIAAADRAALQSTGMRAGLQATRTDRRRNYIKGADGKLILNPLNKGFGMILRAAIGDATTAQQGVTPAYLETFNTLSSAPNEYLTAVMGRPPADPAAAVAPWTYTGGTIYEVEFDQQVGDDDAGQLKFTA